MNNIDWNDVAKIAGQVLAAAATGFASTGTWQGAAVGGIGVLVGLLQQKATVTLTPQERVMRQLRS